MICVIADDLTGAAELGAVGLRHGLRTEVIMLGPNFTKTKTASHADDALLLGLGSTDLLCFDTDSRTCEPTEAGRRAAVAARLAMRMKPALIYKKTDSVLRGPVAAEIKAIMAALGKKRAVLVPANPTRGRVITGGKYYVSGKPIHLTEFASDPLHPRKSSDVRDLIKPRRALPMHVCRPGKALPQAGLIIGEAGTLSDLHVWTGALTTATLPAGGADFFSAILSASGYKLRAKSRTGRATGAKLFVCGTYSESARSFIAKARHLGLPILSLLNEGKPRLRLAPDKLEALATKAVQELRAHCQVILCIGEPMLRSRGAPKRLLAHLTTTAARVLERLRVGHICIEGGATAAALLGKLGWEHLIVVAEVAPGVVTLRPRDAHGCLVTIKPGTYSWPDGFLK